jgi:excisionase family DNA binding protein
MQDLMKGTNNFPERLYTTEEVARILWVTNPTVTQLRRRGQLPFVRVGRLVRIPASGLKTFLQV